MSNASPEADFWHVQLPSGEVRYWSLEELDEAFQEDKVDAKTFVLKEGETTWMRLGELLGLDEGAVAQPVQPHHVSVPIAPYSIQTPVSVRPSEPPIGSIRPVVADVDDMDDDQLVASMRPKKKNMAFLGGGAAAALLLALVGITQVAGSTDAKTAAAQAPAAAAAPPPVEDIVPPQPTLTDEQKRALIEADKAREAKAAARAAENAKYHSNVSSTRAPKSGPVFHKGGNQYDPLSAGN